MISILIHRIRYTLIELRIPFIRSLGNPDRIIIFQQIFWKIPNLFFISKFILQIPKCLCHIGFHLFHFFVCVFRCDGCLCYTLRSFTLQLFCSNCFVCIGTSAQSRKSNSKNGVHRFFFCFFHNQLHLSISIQICFIEGYMAIFR